MFVHFGLYSILGTGEWSKHSLNISDEAYCKNYGKIGGIWFDGMCDSTFRVAADFCEKYDGFIFNHNESILYEWINVFIVIHTFSTLYAQLLSSYPHSFDCAR